MGGHEGQAPESPHLGRVQLSLSPCWLETAPVPAGWMHDTDVYERMPFLGLREEAEYVRLRASVPRESERAERMLEDFRSLSPKVLPFAFLVLVPCKVLSLWSPGEQGVCLGSLPSQIWGVGARSPISGASPPWARAPRVGSPRALWPMQRGSGTLWPGVLGLSKLLVYSPGLAGVLWAGLQGAQLFCHILHLVVYTARPRSEL